MVRNRDPFLTALTAIRERLVTGAYGAGDPIVILDEARRLGLSTTPVREALAWLCGSGLVDRAAVGGYCAPRLEAALLRDWYDFRTICLFKGLKALDGAVISTPPEAGLEAIFDWLVDLADNVALSDAFRRTGRLLQRVKQADVVLFGPQEAMVATVVHAIRLQRIDILSKTIGDYHAARIGSATALALEANKATGGGG